MIAHIIKVDVGTSAVRSWPLALIARALHDDPELAGIQAWVPDSGEGRWTVFEAVDLAAMRQQFGGHAVKRAD